MSKKTKLFLYGTLRPKGIEATHFLPGYTMYDAGRFPYIKQESHVTGNTVYGIVVEVNAKQLRELDMIEGTAHGFYHRQEVTVIDRNNYESCERVETYVGGNVAPQPIASGDWFHR